MTCHTPPAPVTDRQRLEAAAAAIAHADMLLLNGRGEGRAVHLYRAAARWITPVGTLDDVCVHGNDPTDGGCYDCCSWGDGSGHAVNCGHDDCPEHGEANRSASVHDEH